MADANSNLINRLKEIEERNQKYGNIQKTDLESIKDDTADIENSNYTSNDLSDAQFYELNINNDELRKILDDDNSNVEEIMDDMDKAVNEENTKTIAEIAAEKYAPIKMHEKEIKEPVRDDTDFSNALFDGLAEVEKEAKELSDNLQKQQDEYLHSIQTVKAEPISAPEANISDSEAEINDIIDSIDSDDDENKNTSEEPDLGKLLEKFESEKVVVDMISSDLITGPADYIIETDESYEENIEDILASNNIVITKKKAGEKNAILDRFVNSGDRITTVLPNSGIYVSMSGAGAAEIIAMNSMQGNDEIQTELTKLNHICQHITGSSIGRMKLSQLIKVVSYWDMDTLFYAFFAATHPTKSEISKVCDRCGKEFYLNVHTKDLMINPEDFEKQIVDIRDNVTTYARLLETSQLGKVYKKAHSNGMIVFYKHPSIESYLKTARALTDDTKSRHYGITDLAYGIDKIAIRDTGNSFIEIDDCNEILDIISKLKNADEKYEIFDMVESVMPNAKPVYGFKESVCPHCGHKNAVQSFSMETLLFTTAQLEEYEASLRWAVKAQKRKQSRRKLKNV